MEIHSNLALAASVLIGGAAGGIFFFGLRATLSRLPRAKHPALITIFSFLGRAAAGAGGAYLSARLTGFPGLIAFTGGFLAVKVITLSIYRSRNREEGVG